jgi:hypothetical protein
MRSTSIESGSFIADLFRQDVRTVLIQYNDSMTRHASFDMKT